MHTLCYQKLANEAIEKFKTILPDLTEAERKIVNAQKFGIADSVINQIFDNSNKHLNEVEQTQFIELLDKVLKSAPTREQNKIFKGSDNLKEIICPCFFVTWMIRYFYFG